MPSSIASHGEGPPQAASRTTQPADAVSYQQHGLFAHGRHSLGRFADNLLGGLVEDLVERRAVDLLATDIEDGGDRERRYAVQPAMGDAALDPRQHLAQAAYIGEA